MDIILLMFSLIILYGIKITVKDTNNINRDYLSPERTNAINGIFVMFVVFRHVRDYIETGKFDKIFVTFDSRIGQLLVVTFLFYSGYGIMYSFHNKSDYIKRFPKRIFKVLFEFDLIILIFILTNIVLRNKYNISQILLSFIAWENIGNSNWYIFAVLCLYLFTYISFKIFSKNYKTAATMVFVLTVVYIAVMFLIGKDSWWYNTVIVYPGGMYYFLVRDRINNFLNKNKKSFYIIFLIFVATFAVSYKFQRVFILYCIMDITFMLIILMISMKITIGNKILKFLGKYTFEIYMLQRIPFMIFENIFTNEYIIFTASLSTTLVFAVIFKFFYAKLYGKIERII